VCVCVCVCVSVNGRKGKYWKGDLNVWFLLSWNTYPSNGYVK